MLTFVEWVNTAAPEIKAPLFRGRRPFSFLEYVDLWRFINPRLYMERDDGLNALARDMNYMFVEFVKYLRDKKLITSEKALEDANKIINGEYRFGGSLIRMAERLGLRDEEATEAISHALEVMVKASKSVIDPKKWPAGGETWEKKFGSDKGIIGLANTRIRFALGNYIQEKQREREGIAGNLMANSGGSKVTSMDAMGADTASSIGRDNRRASASEYPDIDWNQVRSRAIEYAVRACESSTHASQKREKCANIVEIIRRMTEIPWELGVFTHAVQAMNAQRPPEQHITLAGGTQTSWSKEIKRHIYEALLDLGMDPDAAARFTGAS